jgi:hypothetical protein
MLASIWTGPSRAQAPSAGPQTYIFAVFSNPVAGTEAEYNRWYTTEHAPDVVSIPGFVSFQRFVQADQQLRAVDLKKPRYLALFTVTTDAPAAVGAEIRRRLASGQTRSSPTLDGASVQMFTYRVFRPLMKGVGGEPKDARPGPEETYLQIVFGDATAGQDDAFNTWYDTVHEPQLLHVPGFVDGQRAVLSEVQLAPLAGRSRYLALFHIKTSDLPAVLRGLTGVDAPPPSFDRDRTYGYTYRAITPLVLGDDVRAQRAAAAKAR